MLCPQPSYPLFDYIARLAGVEMTHYRLVESRQWAIDLNYVENQITSRTRAIILISPHNPTGMVADEQQLQGLAEIATRHSLAIISDEVFGEFLFGPDAFPRIAATDAPLVFTLNGFSKMFALPGMKIGWMGVTGDTALVKKSMSALELISDTFLPVNEMAQFAVPESQLVEAVQSGTDEVDHLHRQPVDKSHRDGVACVGRGEHDRCELHQPRL